MLLRQLYDDALAQFSYLVGCQATGEAIVIDPRRDIDEYLALAEREGMTITAVTETHIHADFVSGARELAARTGARLYLSGEGGDDWAYEYAADAGARIIHDGDIWMVGNSRFEVLHTPGHTPEHICLLLTDTAGADAPMGLFSGDFVFAGDVGRPDLLERAAGAAGTMERGARQLYHSLRRFKALPDYLQVWPGHGAGSACGKSLGAVPQTTVGYEKLFNWALQLDDEDEFARRVIADQPEPPVYFKEMKRVNKVGPRPLAELPAPERLPASRLPRALQDGMLVVDTRDERAYAAGHIPGTISIPAGRQFPTWAGWLIPYDRPFGVIVEPGQLDRVVRDLRRIGLDGLAGYWTTDVIADGAARDAALGTIPEVSVDEAAELVESGRALMLDVRGETEYRAGHIPDARHIPLGYLRDQAGTLPADRAIIVHCGTGFRASIAASLLDARGHQRVANLAGGLDAWRAAGRRLEKPEPAAAVS